MTPATRIILLTALPVFLLDRLSKWLVVEVMDLADRGYIQILDPFLNFTMAWNEGINFGLFGGGNDLARYVLIGVGVTISVAVGLWARRKTGIWVPAFAGAVIGGAFGNIFDRLTYGAVADFLNMSCCGIHNPFAFNIADVAIFAGAAGLIVLGDRK